MEKAHRGLVLLNIVTAALMLTAIGLVFLYAPQERVMGEVQRIFYFHVPSAWLSFTAFVVTAIAGGIYLATGRQFWDHVAYSSVEVGLVLTVMATASGSIWARPAWNTWWTWDPRLTTAAITELIYIAYFMLRQGIEEPEKRARFGAVYTLLGGISAPITFMVIRLFRSIHPVIIGAANANQEKMSMSADMKIAFFFGLFAFTIIFIDMIWHRIRLSGLEEKVEQLKLKASI